MENQLHNPKRFEGEHQEVYMNRRARSQKAAKAAVRVTEGVQSSYDKNGIPTPLNREGRRKIAKQKRSKLNHKEPIMAKKSAPMPMKGGKGTKKPC